MELQPDVGRLGDIKRELYLNLNKPWISCHLEVTKGLVVLGSAVDEQRDSSAAASEWRV